jgi:hypothetical protein
MLILPLWQKRYAPSSRTISLQLTWDLPTGLGIILTDFADSFITIMSRSLATGPHQRAPLDFPRICTSLCLSTSRSCTIISWTPNPQQTSPRRDLPAAAFVLYRSWTVSISDTSSQRRRTLCPFFRPMHPPQAKQTSRDFLDLLHRPHNTRGQLRVRS